jgi:FixJ family two-component response regulator
MNAIAVVEDDSTVSEALEALLQAMGHPVMTFDRAEDLLASPALPQIACLITDIQLRGISGLDLQERLRAAGHDIPFIVVTAFPDERVRERALKLGAVAFLVKPVRKAHLVAALAQAIGSP